MTFTGSAATGQQLRAHPNLGSQIHSLYHGSRFTQLLRVRRRRHSGATGIRAVYSGSGPRDDGESRAKCTAIRRIIVPLAQINAVSDALISRLHKVTVGDPAQEGVKMGAPVNSEQRQDVQESVNKLIAAGCEVLLGGEADLSAAGAFFPPTLLYCSQPDETPAVHAIEAFGPVATLMPYRDRQHALTLARAGGGSLAGTLVTASGELAREFILGAARAHGRIQILNEASSVESTGHGSPLPQLVHGGPGRAGGGEELGGLRSVKHYMQRTAVRGQPNDAGDHRSTVGARRPR